MTFRWYPTAPAQMMVAAQKPTGTVAAALLSAARNSHRRGFGLVTGHLRDSYKASSQGTHWVVYNDAEYAVYVEYGTSRMAGQFHLRRAAQETVAQFMDVRFQGGSL